jgi:FtsZ-interacting cell division protein ZipA
MELLSASQMNPRKRPHSLAASESSLSKRPAQEATAASQEQETDKEEEALKQSCVAEEAEDDVEVLILDGVAAEDVDVKGVKMVYLLTDHFDNITGDFERKSSVCTLQ